MRLNELRKYCNFYKKHLGMSDWTFTIKFVNSIHPPGFADFGTVEFSGQKKNALIRILSRSSAKRKKLVDYDQEQILVHEMLHCRYDRVHVSNSPAYEEAIDSTAWCIVNLRRQLHLG